MIEFMIEAINLWVRDNHLVLCGRCFTVDNNGEFRDKWVGGYHYHKHPHERCEICGSWDDVPTVCCPN